MNIYRYILIFLTLFLLSATGQTNACQQGQLSFDFDEIEIIAVFAIFADYAQLEYEFDTEITETVRLQFRCRTWESVAKEIAASYNLDYRVEQAKLYLTKKTMH